jgi:hypothetical protein
MRLATIPTTSLARALVGRARASLTIKRIFYTHVLLVNLGEWQDAYDKASSFVQGLTTAEKISFIGGGDAGNISSLHMLDSSTNPLTYYYVTTWPAGLAMAMTWDKDAILGQGEALGSEFRGKGINLAYAPTLQPLGRSAWGGRTGETYGPDSYFSGYVVYPFHSSRESLLIPILERWQDSLSRHVASFCLQTHSCRNACILLARALD